MGVVVASEPWPHEPLKRITLHSGIVMMDGMEYRVLCVRECRAIARLKYVGGHATSVRIIYLHIVFCTDRIVFSHSDEHRSIARAY